MDDDKRINYTQRLIRESALNIRNTLLAECKYLVMGISGYKWMLGVTKYVTVEKFCTWSNLDGVDMSGYICFVADRFLDFEIYIWFKLGKSIWKKYQSILQNHVKYIHKDIVT